LAIFIFDYLLVIIEFNYYFILITPVIQRLPPAKIREYLDTVIERATINEPLLAKRLREIKKWIAEKKDGLLISKNHILELLTEIILDSELWLNISRLSDDERLFFYQDNQITAAEILWFEQLFPRWFRERDPQSPIWKQKIMAGEEKTFLGTDSKILVNKKGLNCDLLP
jgi:hypothetical protein